MSSNHGDNREETGESSTHSNGGNSEELEIPQSPREKSQRKIVPTEKARRICDFCQKFFEGGQNSARDYQSHVGRCKKFHKFIVDENSTQCSLCPEKKEFANQGTLLLHLEKAHSGKILEKECESKILEKECDICKTTVLKNYWLIHSRCCQKYRGLINKLQCVPCNKNYGSRKSLLAHVSHCHKDLMNNEDGVVAKPTAKKAKKSSKTPQLPKLHCRNCQALFEDEEKLLDHVEICSIVIEPEEDPLISAPSTKQCSFCEDLVPKKNILEHYERCSKAADLIKGIKCTKCPLKQFKSKHEVYGHVLGTHLAIAQEEVVSQYDFAEETMDTGLEAEIPRNGNGTGSQGIEPEPTDIRIVETFGNPNPNGAGTSLVRKEYFTDVDSCVITRLYICPLCKGKLGFKDHARNHITVYHKINAFAFNLLKLKFETIEV